MGEYHTKEILDLSNIPEEKRNLYKPREFYFKIFQPKEPEPIPIDVYSSMSDLIDDDSFDIDST